MESSTGVGSTVVSKKRADARDGCLFSRFQDSNTPRSGSEWPNQDAPKPNEKAILARIWGSFDSRYMKPLLTHSRPTLLETLPVCCNPIARILTTTEQMTQVCAFFIFCWICFFFSFGNRKVRTAR